MRLLSFSSLVKTGLMKIKRIVSISEFFVEACTHTTFHQIFPCHGLWASAPGCGAAEPVGVLSCPQWDVSSSLLLPDVKPKLLPDRATCPWVTCRWALPACDEGAVKGLLKAQASPGGLCPDSGSPVTGFVTSGALLNLSVPQFPFLYNGDNASTYLMGLLWR